MWTEAETPLLTTWLVITGHGLDVDSLKEGLGNHHLAASALGGDGGDSANFRAGYEDQRLDSTDTAVQALLEGLGSSRDPLKRFVKKNNLFLSVDCTVKIHADRPVYELSPQVMKELGWLGADFHLDILDYSGNFYPASLRQFGRGDEPQQPEGESGRPLDEKPPLMTVWFTLGGKAIDIAACTRAVGVEPTKIWRQKHERLLDHPLLSNIVWEYGYKDRQFYNSDDAVRPVVDVVWPRRRPIKAFAKRHALSIGVSCHVTVYEALPVLSLSPEVMTKMASLDADFGWDIYDYTPVADDD